MDNYQPGHTIPSCQVEVDWVKRKEHPTKLSHMLHISGVRPPDTYIRIIRNPILPGQVHTGRHLLGEHKPMK